MRGFLRAEVLEWGQHLRVTSARDRLHVQPEFLAQAEQVELAAIDSDRTGDRRWLTHDAVGRDGYVITTGSGEVGQAGDHWLATRAATNGVPHLVGRGCVSTRTVDAQDDGFDRRSMLHLGHRLFER